jgi:hypothetical protein
MANLTDYLPANMQGKETQRPYDKGPSIFEGIDMVVSAGTEALAGAKNTRDAKAAAAAKAKAAALEASDRGARNDVADAILTAGTAQNRQDATPAPVVAPAPDPISTTASPTPPAYSDSKPAASTDTPAPLGPGEAVNTAQAYADGDNLGQKAAQMQAGVKQGRISEATYETFIETKLGEIFARHPDSKYVALEAMDKYAISHPIMSEYRRARDATDSEIKAQQGREEDAITLAVKSGVDPATDRNTLVTTGLKLQSQIFAREQQSIAYDMEVKRAANDKAKLDDLTKARSTSTSAALHTQISTLFGPAMSSIHAFLSDDSIPIDQRMEAAGNALNVIVPKANEIIDRELTAAVAHGDMTQDDADKERDRLRGMVKDFSIQLDPSNPSNVFEADKRTREVMTNKWHLDFARMMPVYSQFKTILGDSEAVNAVVEKIAMDPKLNDMFVKELSSFQGIATGDATLRLRNMLAFVTTENPSLEKYTPQEAVTVLKDSMELLNHGFYDRAVAGDGNAQKQVLNVLGGAANAAIDLNKGVSSNALINAVQMLTNKPAYNTLRKLTSENKEYGGQVADEMRVGAHVAMLSLLNQGTNDPYYKLVISRRDRNFAVAPTGKKALQADSNSSGSGMFREGTYGTGKMVEYTPPPSAELKLKVEALNNGLQFLQNTTDFEDSPVLKNATNDERFLFYAQGRMPKQSESENKNVNGTELISRIQENFAKFKVDWSSIPQVDVDDRVAQRTGTSSASYADRIAGAENSSGNTNARNPNSSATGDGQFIDSTWLNLMKKYAPRKVEGKSRAEVLQTRADPELSREMIGHYRTENLQELRAMGLPANDQTASLAHFLGPKGAASVLKASNDAPLSSVLPSTVLSANKFLRGKTVGDLLDWAADRIGI